MADLTVALHQTQHPDSNVQHTGLNLASLDRALDARTSRGPSANDGPVPMSMPAILRNPRVGVPVSSTARQTRDGYIRSTDGLVSSRIVSKRRERRTENGM